MARLRIPKSPKVIVGIVLFTIFLVFTVIGPWIAPYLSLIHI